VLSRAPTQPSRSTSIKRTNKINGSQLIKQPNNNKKRSYGNIFPLNTGSIVAKVASRMHDFVK